MQNPYLWIASSMHNSLATAYYYFGHVNNCEAVWNWSTDSELIRLTIGTMSSQLNGEPAGCKTQDV